MTLIIIVFWKMKPKNLWTETMGFLGIKWLFPKDSNFHERYQKPLCCHYIREQLNSRVCFRWDITSKSGYVSISNIRKFNLIYQRNFTQSIVAKWSGKEIVNLQLYVIPVSSLLVHHSNVLITKHSNVLLQKPSVIFTYIHSHVERLLLHIAKISTRLVL